MPAFRDILDRLIANGDDAETWLELVRDLSEPIAAPPPPMPFSERWADRRDIPTLAALEGFVKEIDFMTHALERGDICRLLEHDARICAFAWTTFRDYRLALWHTLHLLPGYAYLVYIFVRPEYQRQGVGYYLLLSLMEHLRKRNCRHLISGMVANWRISIDLHRKAGFRIDKKIIRRRLLRYLPYPPKKVDLSP